MKEIAVLHVDPDPGWRGGQQQALYLHLGMVQQGYKSGFVCNPGSQLQQRLLQHEAPVHAIRFRFEADILAGLQLALYAKRHGYAILHLHSSHALSWGMMAKLLHPSLRLVATRRVNVPISNNLFSKLKYKSRLLTAIVAISEATRKLMLADGIPPRKIHKIYSGVDTQRFRGIRLPADFRLSWKIPETALIVGTVAALVPPKDYPNFINAACLAAKQNPILHFMIVGDGELMGKMQGMARDLGLEGRLTFTGFQSEIGIFLKAFDIFVLASRREGLGTAVLDAMSVGLPVIGTRAGGIAEMIVDGESGLLVEAKNSAALASAILRLATDEALRKQLRSGALERAQHFSKEHMVEANIRLYESL